AAAIRTNMIIGAALAEGLGILAFVLGILLSGKTV
ncbi:MAG: F0F1 ATP synthase subunit C, partial [Chloroflexi bacterium]